MTLECLKEFYAIRLWVVPQVHNQLQYLQANKATFKVQFETKNKYIEGMQRGCSERSKLEKFELWNIWK